MPALQPYYSGQSELTIKAGWVPWGTRVVIPVACQKRVLQELHTRHPDIVKMESIARTDVWWPQVNKQIEELVQNCSACQEVRNKPPLAMLHPWSWPGCPWQRVYVHNIIINFAGPFLGSMFTLVVGVHLKRLEIFSLNTTTMHTEKTLQLLHNLFTSYGFAT